MDAHFWHQKWQANDIGFHEQTTNPALSRHFARLGLAPGSRILVPLCGKSQDMLWLADQGYEVVGVELSTLAVEQFFSEAGLTPSVSNAGVHQCYQVGNITVLVGDIFALTPVTLGPVAGIYDRAALVALPDTMRLQYTRHLTSLTGQAPQLLITFDYDQHAMPGPPFSVPAQWVHTAYASAYQPLLLQDSPVKGGLKGRCPAHVQVWQLLPCPQGSK